MYVFQVNKELNFFL